MIERPERGNFRDDEQLLIANLLDHVPIPHREAVRGTTLSFSHQHQIHTWIGGGLQATVTLLQQLAPNMVYRLRYD